MAFVWDPWGLAGVAAIIAGWIRAGLVYRAAPRRRANVALALLLILEATGVGLVRGVAYFTDDGSFADVGSTKAGLFAVTGTLLVLDAPVYLVLLGTLATPLARPLRGRAAVAVLAAYAVGAEA